MKRFRSYIALALAILVALSATGITISLHKCCGKVEGFSLLGGTKECKMAKMPASHTKVPASKASVEKVPCCSNQQISLKQSSENTRPAVAKNQVKEQKESFDVLFLYNLVTNWFSTSTDQDTETEKPSSGSFITEALILLLQQFRI